MKLNQCVLALASMLLHTCVYSQISTMLKGSGEATLPGVVLPSPDNASLTRSISENVDLYTGQLNLNLPIYTLKSRQIEVAVSLQGNANSIRINDPGSFVGMGWHLNAGGVITRVMRNLPDETEGDYTFFDPAQNGNRTINATGYFNIKNGNFYTKKFRPVMSPFVAADEYSIGQMVDIVHESSWNTRVNRTNKALDLEPDEFYFNFGNYSGKFVINQYIQVVPVIGGSLTITPHISQYKITGFTVKTDDGFTYSFGDYSKNAVEETKYSTFSKATLFTYKYRCTGETYGTLEQGQSRKYPVYFYDKLPVVPSLEPIGADRGNQYNPVFVEAGNLLYNTHNDNKSYSEYPSYPSSWYLTSIQSPSNDIVNFVYENNGSMSFTESVAVTNNHPDMSLPAIPSSNCGNYTTLPFASFSAPVPDINEGYQVHPSFSDQTENVNTVTIQSKRLKEISTPQGYKIIFYRNTPRPEMAGDKRLDKISVLYNNKTIKEFQFDYTVIRNNATPEKFGLTHGVPVRQYAGPYQITWPSEKTIYWDRKFDESMRYRMFLKSIREQGANGELIPPYEIEYFDAAGLPYRTSQLQDKYGFFGSSVPDLNKLKSGVIRKISYPTGGYKEFEFDLNGNQTNWSGVRIKSIRELASAVAVPVIRNYSYGDYIVTDNAVTSYSMWDRVTTFGFPDGYTPDKADRKIFNSPTRVNPENSTRGVPGGYSFVEVSQPGNGTHRFEFITALEPENKDDITIPYLVTNKTGQGLHDLREFQMDYPFPPASSNDWKRGLPKAEYIKNEEGKTVKSSHYNYDYSSFLQNNTSVDGIFTSKYKITFNLISNGSFLTWNWMLFGRYSHYPRWQLQKNVEERDYLADGVTYRSSILENTYTKKSTTTPFRDYVYVSETKLLSNSKNEQLVSKFKYPLDYGISPVNSFMAGVVNLRNKGILTVPVEQYQFLQNPDGSNKRYINGTLNMFHSTHPKIKEVYGLQKGASYTGFYESNLSGATPVIHPDYKVDQQFTNYDAYGNILDQNKINDVNEAYLWDYNSTFPVARIINAKSSDVAYTSFETADLGGWTLNAGSTYLNSTQGTGLRSLAGGIKRTISTAGNYIVTGWGNKNNVFRVNGTDGEILETVGDWVLKKWTLTNPSTVEVIAAYMDEVRLYPANARMTTFTFSPLTGMTSRCDENNRIIHYEYDGLQRLTITRNEKKEITGTVEYNYQEKGTDGMAVSTGETRCKPCEANPQYTTNIRQVKMVNRNPQSPTYNESYWWDIGPSTVCNIQPGWQQIGTPSCALNSNGVKTGMQNVSQRDMNPCSPTYNTTRVIQVVNYASCPSTLPNWQPAEELRCQPCPSNPNYHTTVQQRKFIDQNPSSSTYNQVEWHATGNTCIVQPDWQFTTTAPRCQKDQNGVNTGKEEKEQKDMNPCSNTYNTTKWVESGFSSSCPGVFKTLYFDIYMGDYSFQAGDVYIYYYEDPEMTIPSYVVDDPYTIGELASSTCGPQVGATHTGIGNGPYWGVLGGVYFWRLFSEYCETTYDYFLLP